MEEYHTKNGLNKWKTSPLAAVFKSRRHSLKAENNWNQGFRVGILRRTDLAMRSQGIAVETQFLPEYLEYVVLIMGHSLGPVPGKWHSAKSAHPPMPPPLLPG